jgi:AraC family transcriptional activator of tynA and feaB
MEYLVTESQSLPSADDIAKISMGAWILRGETHHVAMTRPQSANASIKLLVQLEGRAEIRQCGRRLTLAQNQFTLIDGARPFSATMDKRFVQALVVLPRSAVLGRCRGIEGCVATHYGEEGVDAFVGDVAASLAKHAPRLSPAAMLRAVAALVDLISDLDKHGRRDARALLLQRAMALIDLEVSDLDAERLASRLGVSRRYLDALFVQSGRTVSHHLWERRLQLAAERLQFSKLSSITEIAHSVGFKDTSHFSRAFRNRFGVSPRDWRRSEQA